MDFIRISTFLDVMDEAVFDLFICAVQKNKKETKALKFTLLYHLFLSWCIDEDLKQAVQMMNPLGNSLLK